MDLMSGIQTSVLASYSTGTGDAVTLATLKKALNLQKSQAEMLISSVSATPPSHALPDNLGRNINVTA